jgi:serine/threonine protein phosphatase 1
LHTVATIAIGDVHGRLAPLDDLLIRLEEETGADDTVVFLGDYIDRGPDSRAYIDRILRFRAESPATVVALAGNHEDWLLRTLDDFCSHSWLLGMDGFDTIASYSPAAADVLHRAAADAGSLLVLDKIRLPYDVFLEAMPAEHLTFLRQLRLFHRTDDAICVHGGIDLDGGPIEEQPRDSLIWGTEAFLRRYAGPATVVYGHWNNAERRPDGWPLPAVRPASIGIDTIAHGVLTAISLPERRVIQSGRY